MTKRAKARQQTAATPDDRRASFGVIVGGAPPDHEWSSAEMLRLCTPKIKQLRFVKNKPNAEPMWMPESYWDVPLAPRWQYEKAHSLGKEFAVQAVAAMRHDGANVLANIFRDMIGAGVKRELERRKEGRRAARRDPAMGGFLHQLAAMLLPSID